MQFPPGALIFTMTPIQEQLTTAFRDYAKRQGLELELVEINPDEKIVEAVGDFLKKIEKYHQEAGNSGLVYYSSN